MKKEKPIFRKDDVVEWTSQAGGRSKTKRGVVVAVVPPETGVLGVEECYREQSGVTPPPYSRQFDGGLWRSYESYLVLVPGPTDKSLPRLYYPRVTSLELVHRAETTAA